MTKEDKELLLRDLSARLCYGVIVNYKEDKYDFHKWKISTLHAPAYSRSGDLINTDSDGWIEYEDYKGCGMSTGSRPLHIENNLPFLRPMSSMTEEERKELLCTVVGKDAVKYFQVLPDGSIDNTDASHQDLQNFTMHWVNFNGDNTTSYIDWLNKHHFDYRGLIERGLALEVPDGMYNLNKE